MGAGISVVGRKGSFHRRFPAQPASVSEARRAVADLLFEADREDLVDTAALLVSEVVTNALLHAGTPIDLVASVGAEGLRVEVGDGSSHVPVRRRYAATAGTGRGMMMLESLVDDWGVARHGDGKTVWFELSHGEDTDAAVAALQLDDSDEPPERTTVDVTLLNVPLLLHAAWEEHAAALLREYLLASMDVEDDDRAIQVHADATDAMAILEEQVPHAEVTMAPDQLMRDVADPNLTSARVGIEVPVASVEHFRVLDDAIEGALQMAEDGLFLTPPTQPEIQAFRRWVCSQVIQQARGRQPERWSVTGASPTRLHQPLDWDGSAIRAATHAAIAADDANYIIEVSDSALELLGYRDRAELVGRRITRIIPDRYRQAHVAGFTMYFLTGRQPLIDTAVTVPALRADGTETTVDLLVEVRPGPGGREMFVATLRPVGAADPR
ncbi:MAG: ATP-binding protein [Nocardioidaceae bacterium]